MDSTFDTFAEFLTNQSLHLIVIFAIAFFLSWCLRDRIAILSPTRKFSRGLSVSHLMLLLTSAAFLLPSSISFVARAKSQEPIFSNSTLKTEAVSQLVQAKTFDQSFKSDDDWKKGQQMEFCVIDAVTKEPINDVSLELQYAGTGIDFSDVKVQTTDKDGKSIINLPDLPPKSVRVYPSKPGYVPLRVFWAADPSPAMPKTVTIPMHPGKEIGGTVLDEAGNPIAGVEVSVHYWGTGEGENPHVRVNICPDNYKCKGLATSDKNGRWTIDVLPEEIDRSRFNLYFSHPDFYGDVNVQGLIGSSVYKIPDIKDLINKTATTKMKTGSRLRGIIRTEAGKAISNAKIYYNLHDGFRAEKPVAVSEESGKFQISGLKPIEKNKQLGGLGRPNQNAISLTVVADGYAPELVEVLDSKSPVMVKMKPGNSVSGRVIDENGNPLKDVSIWAQNWKGSRRGIRLDTKTDAQGKFVLNDVPADEVQYDIAKNGYMMIDEAPMRPGGKAYSFTLTRPFQVTGSVVDADTGEKIEVFSQIRGFEYEDGRAPDWQLYQKETVRNGKFSSEFRQKGFMYRIRVEADGYQPAESEVIRPGATETRSQTIEFKLTKADPIVGSVIGLDGIPLADAKVVLARSRVNIRDRVISYDEGNPVTKTDSAGQFQFPPEVEPFCVVVIHEKGVGMITGKELDATKPISIEAWNDENKQMQIIRRPAEGQSVDFPTQFPKR